MRYDELASLSPVVRKEVLTGELSRRVKAMEIVPENNVDAVVQSLVNVSLSEVMQCIEDPTKLKDQVHGLNKRLNPTNGSPSKSPSPSTSQDSRLLDPNSLAATASAPEHPSTPISVTTSISPPRTSSPTGSVPPATERDRVLAAIGKLESSRQEELTDLVMTLPKRDRAMCLFNAEVLRVKLSEAKDILDSTEGEEEPKQSDSQSTKSAPHSAPVTPQTKRTAVSHSEDSPQTPALSSRGPSAASSPFPGTPGGATHPIGGATHTLASLSRLPASEIVKLASSLSATGLPLPKADPIVVEATDQFIDSLSGKAPQVQKQQLGEKL